MKLARTFLLLPSVLLPLSLLAQQSTSPESSPFSLGTQKPPSGDAPFQLGPPPELKADSNTTSLPLIPQATPSTSSEPPLGDLPSFDLHTRKPDAPLPDGPNRTEEAALQLAKRIRFREVKARAAATPEVQSALDSANNAHNDREMRSWLRKHYELLYGRMGAIDPSLRSMIEAQQTRALTPLTQTIGPEKR